MAEEQPFFVKKWFWALVAIAIIGLSTFGWFIGTYNNFIKLDQNVNNQWGQVESQYQRRYDLIPNLVASVKGYMAYEKALLENVTFYRSQWGNAKTPDEKVDASNGLESVLSKLIVVMENYPQLKADTQVQKLMDELAGTENRIAVERMRYNDVVKSFNTAIQVFPANIIANMYDYHQKKYFESGQGADIAPKVEL